MQPLSKIRVGRVKPDASVALTHCYAAATRSIPIHTPRSSSIRRRRRRNAAITVSIEPATESRTPHEDFNPCSAMPRCVALATRLRGRCIDAAAATRTVTSTGSRGTVHDRHHRPAPTTAARRPAARRPRPGLTSTRNGTASCAGGSCNSQSTTTGPRGAIGDPHRRQQHARTARCTSTATRTGFLGGTRTRNSSVDDDTRDLRRVERIRHRRTPSTRGVGRSPSPSRFMAGRVRRRTARRVVDTHDLRESAASFGIAVGQSLLRVVEAGALATAVRVRVRRIGCSCSTSTSPARARRAVRRDRVRLLLSIIVRRIASGGCGRRMRSITRRRGSTSPRRSVSAGPATSPAASCSSCRSSGSASTRASSSRCSGINLLYQFFVHTELVPTLGPLEWFLEHAGAASRPSCVERRAASTATSAACCRSSTVCSARSRSHRSTSRCGTALAGRAPSSQSVADRVPRMVRARPRPARVTRLAAARRVLFGPPRSRPRHCAARCVEGRRFRTHGHVQESSDETVFDLDRRDRVVRRRCRLRRHAVARRLRQQPAGARAACRTDAGRLCANVEPGGGRKLICLRGHLAELSSEQDDVLAPLAAARKGDATSDAAFATAKALAFASAGSAAATIHRSIATADGARHAIVVPAARRSAAHGPRAARRTRHRRARRCARPASRSRRCGTASRPSSPTGSTGAGTTGRRRS